MEKTKINTKEFLEVMATFEKLKDTTRHCWTTKGRQESVAEHSWRIAVIAFLLQDEFKELNADINKVILMSLFHDLGEAVTGDIPAWKKTDKDREIEVQELTSLLNNFPDYAKNKIGILLDEFEKQITIEAKFSKALDKFETIIQHNESDISTWTEKEIENHTTNFHYLDKFLLNPFLQELKEELHSQMWDKVNKNK